MVVALPLSFPLLATSVPVLPLRCLLIPNRLLRLPVYLRVLLPTSLPLARGGGGALLVRVARQREFPGKFLVADAAGAWVAAEGP
ncbi:hypothetical protein CNMCM6936_004591 [Aspergillus lentulus]|uniref:Secreted protein n=1 Tax=Aspergillus lentulus TaxID=293939 RepID=A0AAN5YGI6_ASPLE|nr:hypothetical protein CNMCM6069_004369 [Aspergillus lentulus]KAF4159176.1 hypothetical protein CNMCM6936_004591 [Aspergillus lentulus]KAF4172840.1 hypothetical protein CNMCM8060_000992 [Aspergillus lentulus]KAF4176696.1 hypothetical protein CNMCM7927_003898 [Aspergillus lentulus]KAF4189402.1 hypothetical protein CNMCM8694_004113 [Aspergillus lentulus]